MYGPPGHLYVYFTYGMHWCANVVCAPAGTCGAVLIRALQPLSGMEEMYAARPKARRERDLCSGPAKLCQALSIDGERDGIDLARAEAGIELRDDDTSPDDVAASVRIGLAPGKGEELPWRYFVPGDPNISGSPRA